MEFRESQCLPRESKQEFKSITVPVMCYRGPVVAPKWKDVDPCWYLFGFMENDEILLNRKYRQLYGALRN
jgi:hypothetical protein